MIPRHYEFVFPVKIISGHEALDNLPAALAEADVIRIMRRELKASSFRLWRKRVAGRVTKHRARFAARMFVPDF